MGGVMAIQFCSDCGDTLPISMDQMVKCDCCKMINKNQLLSKTTISTTSNFPSLLREKLTSKTQALTADVVQDSKQRTEKLCPDCNKEELTFSQAQTRGADEGSTIFYFCLNCGHRSKEDN
ncbi:hypothetical protein VC83_03390 [Pseudogymnoascus destructans]|uniref:DNA-directed RNA polymerase subunit n=2 Tax=Pseudogymnoascus destructans TaxID=655981 RepID=L8FSQ7_PSED2|nr:uncharacterized protein VC83_03390 [Pseudogymnoascus destructans]ELR03513.1 hypothetical protein GMDG_01264 [Pseudogymnoascus destructans 20631-21]OAF60657.1 hypothetical protein VC83_03390 [Pseudogymnoascus destructans]